MNNSGCGCGVLMYHGFIIGAPLLTWMFAPLYFNTVLFVAVLVCVIPHGIMAARDQKFHLTFWLDYVVIAMIAAIVWMQIHPGQQDPIRGMTSDWIQCMSDSNGATTSYYGPKANAPQVCIPPATPATLGVVPRG